MANVIRIKRGLKADIDKLTLVAGELGIALDTQELYVGDANGNKQLVVGKASGTVNAAEKLATARNISATGDATGSVAFDGSQDVEIALALANSGVTAGTYSKVTVDEKGRVTVGAQLTTEDLPTIEITDVEGLEAALNAKANSADVYAKTETYNKTEIDNAIAAKDSLPAQAGNAGKFLTTDGTSASWGVVDLSSKADASDLSALSTQVGTLEGTVNTLSGTVDTKAAQSDLEALEGVVEGHTTTIATLATKQELTNAQNTLQGNIDLKANSADVYTKEEANDLLDGKAAKATTLAGYGIGDAYTKTEVDGMVAGTFHFRGEAASFEALPTNAKEGDVYQVADKEYAYNGTSWVELGFNIDLSAYAKSADVAETYATKTALSEGLATKANSADVYTKGQIDTTVSGLNTAIGAKANSSDVYTKAETYTKEEVNTELNKKANSATTLAGYGITDAYTKTETDNLLTDKLTTSSVIDGGTFGA